MRFMTIIRPSRVPRHLRLLVQHQYHRFAPVCKTRLWPHLCYVCVSVSISCDGLPTGMFGFRKFQWFSEISNDLHVVISCSANLDELQLCSPLVFLELHGSLTNAECCATSTCCIYSVILNVYGLFCSWAWSSLLCLVIWNILWRFIRNARFQTNTVSDLAFVTAGQHETMSKSN